MTVSSVSGWRSRRTARVALAALLVAGSVLTQPERVSAQFQEPCELKCIGVLGVTGFVAATGAAVAAGRLTGGMSTVNQGLLVWGSTMTLVVGGGMGLSGNGHRQERAVYAAGLGMLAGALTGFTFETLRTGGDGPRVLAGALIGASVGVIAAGVYGAVSYDGESTAEPMPLLSLTIPF